MVNAREELAKFRKNKPLIKCAKIGLEVEYNEYKWYELPVDHSYQDLSDFMKSLDFDYDNGYGGQELYGTIWFNGGTWATRGEYDGSEWWEYHECPGIPEELINGDKTKGDK